MCHLSEFHYQDQWRSLSRHQRRCAWSSSITCTETVLELSTVKYSWSSPLILCFNKNQFPEMSQKSFTSNFEWHQKWYTYKENHTILALIWSTHSFYEEFRERERRKNVKDTHTHTHTHTHRSDRQTESYSFSIIDGISVLMCVSCRNYIADYLA